MFNSSDTIEWGDQLLLAAPPAPPHAPPAPPNAPPAPPYDPHAFVRSSLLPLQYPVGFNASLINGSNSFHQSINLANTDDGMSCTMIESQRNQFNANMIAESLTDSLANDLQAMQISEENHFESKHRLNSNLSESISSHFDIKSAHSNKFFLNANPNPRPNPANFCEQGYNYTLQKEYESLENNSSNTNIPSGDAYSRTTPESQALLHSQVGFPHCFNSARVFNSTRVLADDICDSVILSESTFPKAVYSDDHTGVVSAVDSDQKSSPAVQKPQSNSRSRSWATDKYVNIEFHGTHRVASRPDKI